jgi:BMFP domain-containing protein YqiC
LVGAKFIKLLGLILGVAVLNILVFSPGFLGVGIGENALATAFGVTLLLASTLILFYGSYVLLFKPPVVIPIKQIQTHEDYVEALIGYRRVKALEDDITLALEQLDRMRKKQETLLNVLIQRFEPNELSYKKFASVAQEVEKLFYLNVRSVLNRLNVFDESEFESVRSPKSSRFSRELLQEKTEMYNEHLSFVKNSLGTNEEILLKLDKLQVEISRLDSFEPGDIENMPCMQEIDSLIKQTKYYKQ